MTSSVNLDSASDATAFLPLPWLEDSPRRIANLLLAYGSPARVEYHGALSGMSLAVDILAVGEPRRAEADAVPGHVVLVTGDLGPAERARLRAEEVSFVTSDGVAEFWWPHLRVSAVPDIDGRPATARSQARIPLKGSHGRVVQQLLSHLVAGVEPYRSLSDLAEDVSVSPSTVSHVMGKLERHGLVVVEREGRTATPRIADPLALARALRAATALSTVETYSAYIFGRDLDERLGSLAEVVGRTHTKASDGGHELAITGLVGAAAYGEVRSNIPRADVWLRVPSGHEPEVWMLQVGLEPVEDGSGPIRVGVDRTGAGVLGVKRRRVGDVILPIADRVRVWVDVQDLARGPDIAAQLIDWSDLGDRRDHEWTH